MSGQSPLSRRPAEIRAARALAPGQRAVDLAAELALPEAALPAAHVGFGAFRLPADPGVLLPEVQKLGDVLALTRNASAVHERRGTYPECRRAGPTWLVHGPEIDLRIFPEHWVHAFALTGETASGPRASVQIFDASGTAVHKIWLGEESDHDAFRELCDRMALPAEDCLPDFAPLPAPEPARADPARAEALRSSWAGLADPHQFLPLLQRLGMNRLGANRLAGGDLAVPLSPDALPQILHDCAEGDVPVMIFVGNAGCLQIHSGPVKTLKTLGPWFNVLDPRFNLHLRQDQLAELWCVRKPARSGPAISLEAFDAQGQLIAQIYGLRKDQEAAAAWEEITARAAARSTEAAA